MTVQQIAHRLAELCNQGDFEKAQKELFSEDAVSIEPEASPAFEKETKGLKAILEKGEKFKTMVDEFYGCGTSDPLVAGNSIAMVLNLDAKMKDRERATNSEICVYKVKDGKIVSEQFFM